MRLFSRKKAKTDDLPRVDVIYQCARCGTEKVNGDSMSLPDSFSMGGRAMIYRGLHQCSQGSRKKGFWILVGVIEREPGV